MGIKRARSCESAIKDDGDSAKRRRLNTTDKSRRKTTSGVKRRRPKLRKQISGPRTAPGALNDTTKPSSSQSSFYSLPRVSWLDIESGRKLGCGCFGTVYEAKLRQSDGQERKVALKCPTKENNSYEYEARVLLELGGVGGAPQLVGLTSTSPEALVMELVEGITLIKYMDMNRNNPEKRRLIIHRLIDVVEEFHRAGYAHNDLHMGNIMIDKNGRVRLIDVGLAVKIFSYDDDVKDDKLSLDKIIKWYMPK